MKQILIPRFQGRQELMAMEQMKKQILVAPRMMFTKMLENNTFKLHKTYFNS